jgi:hypothetical protein
MLYSLRHLPHSQATLLDESKVAVALLDQGPLDCSHFQSMHPSLA